MSFERRCERARDGHCFELVFRGGRIADVFIDGKCVDTTELDGWDWRTGSRGLVTDDQLRRELDEWIDEHGDEFVRELPFL